MNILADADVTESIEKGLRIIKELPGNIAMALHVSITSPSGDIEIIHFSMRRADKSFYVMEVRNEQVEGLTITEILLKWMVFKPPRLTEVAEIDVRLCEYGGDGRVILHSGRFQRALPGLIPLIQHG